MNIDGLFASAAGGKPPHAAVIDGGTSSQRIEAAKRTAMILLCENAYDAPCGKCRSCLKALSSSHPDMILVTLPEDKKTYPVDTLRAVRDDAYLVPNESDMKIYIIDSAELMPPYAQNALLKVLEEPPSYVMFILLCEGRAALLPTVMSRCTRYSLSLEDELPQMPDTYPGVLKALACKDGLSMLDATSVLYGDDSAANNLCAVLEQVVCDALAFSCGSDVCLSGLAKDAREISRIYSPVQLGNMIKTVRDTQRALSDHANKNLTLTRFCAGLSFPDETEDK